MPLQVIQRPSGWRFSIKLSYPVKKVERKLLMVKLALSCMWSHFRGEHRKWIGLWSSLMKRWKKTSRSEQNCKRWRENQDLYPAARNQQTNLGRRFGDLPSYQDLCLLITRSCIYLSSGLAFTYHQDFIYHQDLRLFIIRCVHLSPGLAFTYHRLFITKTKNNARVYLSPGLAFIYHQDMCLLIIMDIANYIIIMLCLHSMRNFISSFLSWKS